MSHDGTEDIAKYKVIWDGPERFSDKCQTCKHSRADHLSVNQLRPVGGGKCRVAICKLVHQTSQGDSLPHNSKICQPTNCECEWKVS